VTACSDGGGKKPTIIPDAPMQMIDAPTASCTAPTTLGNTFTNPTFAYAQDTSPDAGEDEIPGNADDGTPGNQEAWRSIGELDADAKKDLLWIEFFEGPAPLYTTADFPAAPFTVALTAGEADYFKCSACLSLTTDYEEMDTDGDGQPDDSTYVDDYMAGAGSLQVTALSATEITGTLTNVTFIHVDMDFDQGVQTDNASGCRSTAASIPFTATMAAFDNGKRAYAVELPRGFAKRHLRHR
jgi:hypothetical protein